MRTLKRAFCRSPLLLLVSLLGFTPGVFAAIDVSIGIGAGYDNPIFPGDVTAYQIILQNSNTINPVSGTAFTNNMPPALEVAGAGLVSYICTDGAGANTAATGTVTANVGSSTISLAGGTVPIAAGLSGRCVVLVEVTSTVQGATHTNTIPINAVTGSDGAAVSNGSQAQQSITVLSLNDPTISKSFDQNSVVENDETVRLSMVIDNSANALQDLPLNQATDTPVFGLQDTLPAGLEVAATPNAAVTCSSGSTTAQFTPSATDTTLTVVGGAIPAGESCTFAVDLVGTSTGGNYSLSLNNTIDRNTQFGNKRGLVPSSNASDTLAVTSALEVDTLFTPSTVRQGESAILTVTLSNASPSTTLTGVSLTQNSIRTSGSGAGSLTISGVAANAACGGGDVVAINGNQGFAFGGVTAGMITPGSDCVVTITYSGSLAGAGVPETFTHTVSEGAVTNIQGAISQPAAHTLTVVDELLVSKSANPSNPAPGNPVEYTVSVNNFANTALTAVRISDPLPAGMLALTSPAPAFAGTGCSGVLVNNIAGPPPSTTTVELTFNMNAGSGPNPAVCNVTFWAMLPAAAAAGTNLDNQIPAMGVCDANGAGSNCNAAASGATSARVTTADALTVSKVFSPSSLSEGAPSTLTIDFNNLSSVALSSVAFVDNLPLGSTGLQLQVADPSNASSNCAGAVITATPGAASVAMASAVIDARANNGTGAFGTCQLQVDVVGAAGNYVNVLPTGAATATETLADTSTRMASSPGPVQAILTHTPALASSKSFAPTTIQSGGQSTVSVRLDNIGSATLNNVSVNDVLPAGMVVASPVDAYTTCAGSTVVTALAGANSVSLTGAVIPADGQCELLFDVVATGAGSWVNSIPAGNITANGGVQNVNPVNATLDNSSAGAVTVTNAINPAALSAPGETATLTINLLNNGTVDLTNLSLTDYFTNDGTSGGAATAIFIAPTPNAVTTCGGVATAEPDGSSVELTGGSLTAGNSCAITVQVSLLEVGTVQDVIPVSAISTDQGISNTLNTIASVSSQANIGVTKQFIPANAIVNERVRARIEFINPLVQPITNVSVIDNLPANVIVPAGPNLQSDCSGLVLATPGNTVLDISGVSLAGASGGISQTCFVEIDVIASSNGSYTNMIGGGDVNASAGGSIVSNPSPAEATLEVRDAVTITKQFAPNAVAPGVPSTLSITINNANTIPLTGVSLVDVLPGNLVVALTPNESTTCVGGVVSASVSATQVSLSGAVVPASGGCVIEVDTLSNTAGTYSNVIPANALGSEQGVSNAEPAIDELQVSFLPEVGKQFSPPVIPANGTSTLTIVISNDNDAVLMTSANFDDVLPSAPSQMVVAAVPNASSNCIGVLVANAGTSLVRLNSGATIPAGGCSIDVDVMASTAGSYINSIPGGALTTNLGSNLQPANTTLEVSPLGYVSGKVFADNNVMPNGAYDATLDQPLAGVVINLRDAGDTIVATVMTDDLGNYLFSGLSAGTYSVEQPVQPAGTLNGITTAGTLIGAGGGATGVATNIATVPSRINNIILGAGAEIDGSVDNTFAEVLPSSIRGRVFVDANNNGLFNGADTPLAAVIIELLDAGNAVIQSLPTNANGEYAFENLAPGSYSVRQSTQPVNTANGMTVAGTVANDGLPGAVTNATTLPSQISSILLPPATDTRDNDFAELSVDRRVSGNVFVDFDSNGTSNGADHGIDSVTIDLTGIDINGNPVNRSTATNADGEFTFDQLPEGTYTLSQSTQPAGSVNGTTTAGSTGGAGSNPTATSSQITAIDLTGVNTVSGDNLFAEQAAGSPDLSIGISHSPASFAEGSGTGFYTVSPSNIGPVDTSGTVTIVTTLPPGITASTISTSGDWVCMAVGQTVTCTSDSVIPQSGVAPNIIIFVDVADGLAGQLLTANTQISGGSEVAGLEGNNTDSDPTTISQPASIEGSVWRDINHDRIFNPGEPTVEGWLIELLLGDVVVASDATNASGEYQFIDVAPGSGYEVRFREPTTGVIWGGGVPNETGAVFASGVTGPNNPGGADIQMRTLTGITLLSGANIIGQSLPLDPSGVVYDSITRQPVAGARVTIAGPGGFDPDLHLVGGAANVEQTTGIDGFYQYLLQGTAPAGEYVLAVQEPGGYLPGGSVTLPVCNTNLTVGAAPDPALVHISNTAPASAAPIHDAAACSANSAGLPATNNSTQYYLRFVITPGVSADVLNNHIPLDLVTSGAISVLKSTPLVNVSRGDLVPYTLTLTNTLNGALTNVDVIDQIPPGFQYRRGSASVDGISIEPVQSGRSLRWPNINFAIGEQHTVKLMLVIGAAVGEAEYVNQAWAENNLVEAIVSNIATATVRVVPDPTFDCSDLIGKVFDDRNVNGYQDDGELGIANARVANVRGLLVTTDNHGRFHITCAAIPNETRGSNFILKLDPRSLPTGYRITTENPRVVRLTRGKLNKLNFGAALHRVVRLDTSAAAFDSNNKLIDSITEPALAQIIDVLKAKPSVLRIAYHATAQERESDVQKRMKKMKKHIAKRWRSLDCCYPLDFEFEVLRRTQP